MSTPKISFICPVYKKPPEVFKRCLRRLFDQSLKKVEVICVFDGPDPVLEEIASKFPVKSIVIEHGGAPKARNRGLVEASGDYVSFWDSDCYIKPEASKRAIQEFELKPEIDFVYSGYEMAGERGGFDSESFDPYSLTCGNYISSMAFIKKEKAFAWDETLKGAQDWDYWLTAVEKGLKGSFIQGYPFIADSNSDGISQSAWSTENRETTIRIVKEKHGIPDREIGVYSHQYTDRALKLAKILGADLIKPSGKNVDRYKMMFVLGYGFASRFDGIPKDTVKIQYWIPAEIEALAEARYSVVMETIRIAKGVINYCNTPYEKNRLSELGIAAEVLPLPLAEEDIAKVETALPEKFKVLLVADEAYGKLLQELPVDLPHIEFVQNQAKVKEFSALLSFYRFAALDDALLVAQVNGRNVISNVQAPYCGYIDPDQDYEKFKAQLYQKIREVRDLAFNKQAQDYYLEHASPRKFKESVLALMPKVLEIV